MSIPWWFGEEKKTVIPDIYRKEEINEYWIVDWQKKQIEIYSLDYDENKEINFDELFDMEW